MKSPRAFSRITGRTQLFDKDGTERAAYKSSLVFLGESDRAIEEIHFGQTGNVELKKVFDAEGLLQEEIAYNADGSLNFRYVVSYDDQDREQDRTMLFDSGSLHGRWSSSYDAEGMLIERSWFNREGVKEVTERFEYDEKKRLRRKERAGIGEWTYVYDNAGRLSRIRGGYFSADEPDDESYEYDEQGRVSRMMRFYATGELRSLTTYEYARAN